MDVKTKKQINRYTIFLMKEILSETWDIIMNYKTSPDPEDGKGVCTYASIDPDYTYRRASLNIYPSFWKQDEEERKMDLIHEILHIPLGFYEYHMESDIIKDLIPHTTRQVLEDSMRKDEENQVCGLTKLLYEQLG